MRTTPDNKDLTIDVAKDIQFSDIFNLVDIQRLQDLFSDATGVASIITHPDGRPITNPSNFCRLCLIIRKTEKGRENCYQSDAVLGRFNSSGPEVHPCLSGGLWDAGSSITVGGKHIANWLIGQVRNEELDDKRMIQYANEIGADKTDFMEALKEVPVMSIQQFKKVSKMLFEFANELSEKAYSNLQLKMQISESKQAELLLKEKNKQIESQKEKHIQINKELSFQNEEKEKRAAELIIANKELAFQNQEKEKRAAALIIANKELAFQNEEKEKRAVELIIANKELLFQNEEKEKRAAELFIANKELLFQNEEKEKRAAELIIANEHAQESDNLKTAFLNNISHEIRTPFNGILGFLSLIQEDDLTESERDEYIKIINKSAFRLMNTINDIIEISQIQAGQTKLSVSETNIRSLTRGVYNHFKTEAVSKGLKFVINNDLPINIDCIYTDNTKLNTILTILIGNAIKFTQTGSIEFGIKLKSDGDPPAAGVESIELEFSVKDTGISIPENKQQAIFERFMQSDGSNTRLFEGSGIGLSIAKAYVEMLGGNIRVESEEGKGAEFYFTIPCNYEPPEKNVLKKLNWQI